MDIGIEFMNEDELLQEFHRAGIFLPGEKDRLERVAQSNQLAAQYLNQLAAVQSPQYRPGLQGIGSILGGSLGNGLGIFR